MKKGLYVGYYWWKITGFVQENDTQIHHALKTEYRKKESQLILRNFSDHLQNVPAPDHNGMIKMLQESMKSVKFDNKRLPNLMGYKCAERN